VDEQFTRDGWPTERRPLSATLRRKLRGEIGWDAPEAPLPPEAATAVRSRLDGLRVVHLGSGAGERWSVQQMVRAVTQNEVSAAEASLVGLRGRDVVCWSPTYWYLIPEGRRTHNRVICFYFHGSDQWVTFDDPQIIAALCMNEAIADGLRQRQPSKPVRVVNVGGVEDAAPYARRAHPTRKIRLFMAGNASGKTHVFKGGRKILIRRKGAELIEPVARRLDPECYAWVFVGTDWEPYAQRLAAGGWTVIYPGPLEAPGHYEYFGEGDIHLMLAREEGGPLTLLEAMGLGMWTISTPAGIAPAVVRHGQTGYLVPPLVDGNNLEPLAETIATHILSLDQETLRAARPRVRESVAHRTWGNFKAEVEAFMQECFPTE
jgi:glycosyltransferase involved in cell wall biosynthesis